PVVAGGGGWLSSGEGRQARCSSPTERQCSRVGRYDPQNGRSPAYSGRLHGGLQTDCVLLLRLRLRANPFLVGGHPIISNFSLCSREEYFAAADLITIESFQPVLYVRVPLQARIRLRPKVLLLVGAADLNRNEMVDL